MFKTNLRNQVGIGIIFVLCLFYSNILEAQTRVINNERLRFGNGTQTSINNVGNLEQPFYKNSSGTWRKLTYSTYPLDIRWGVSGSGSSNWNVDGTMANNPTLSNLTFDYSGFTVTNVTTGQGYGVAKVQGDFTIDSKLMQVDYTYTLLQPEGYIKINVKLTNKSGGNVSNIRMWIGTRDDYVGATDRPTKERGNLVDGAFELITAQSQQAAAIKVKTADEAILFYSTSDRAYATISSCCSFTNATNQNPASNVITQTGDGSYAMYSRMNDLANNESDEFEIYYAAGSLADIDDIVAAVAAAAGSVTDITEETANFVYNVSESGTTNYIVVPDGSTAPDTAEIIAGVNYGGVTVIGAGSVNSVANVDDIIPLTGLTNNTTYDIYAITEYNNGVSDVYTDITTASFTTVANDNPSGSSISAQTFCINSAAEDLAFTITDNYPVGGSFALSGTSSNTSLLLNSGITFGGSGVNRTVTVTPIAGQTGTATVTVAIQDDLGAVGNVVFNITVQPYGGACPSPSVIINPHTTIHAK